MTVDAVPSWVAGAQSAVTLTDGAGFIARRNAVNGRHNAVMTMQGAVTVRVLNRYDQVYIQPESAEGHWPPASLTFNWASRLKGRTVKDVYLCVRFNDGHRLGALCGRHDDSSSVTNARGG